MRSESNIQNVDNFFGSFGDDQPEQLHKQTDKPFKTLQIVEFRDNILGENTRQHIQQILAEAPSYDFVSYEMQQRVTSAISDLATAGNWSLTYDGLPVRIRAINPRKSDVGYFQLRGLGTAQVAVYTGRKFPTVTLTCPS